MLSNKYRMPAHRCLFPVVCWLRRCEALGNEVGSMRQNDRQASVLEIGELSSAEPESGSEAGTS